MQKKSCRRSQSSAVAQSVNPVMGSLMESLENRTLLSAALQPLAAKAAATLPVVTASTYKTGKAMEDGSRLGYIEVVRTGSTSNALTVNVAISGTARNGRDYETLANKVTFAAGQSKTYITVKPLQDTVVERAESVNVMVLAGTGYTVGASNLGSVRIIDDDAPTVSVSAVQDAMVAEDSNADAYLTFTRSGDLKRPVTINFAIKGRAVNGTDYVTIPQSVTIRAGKTKASLRIQPIDDLMAEGDEYVDVRIRGGYYNVSNGRAYVKIQDNDTAQIGLDMITFRGPVGADGSSYILRAPATGGAPTTLSVALSRLGKTGLDYAANASPDGQWMLFSTTRFGGLAGGSLALIPSSNLAAGQQILLNGTDKIAPVDGNIAVASGGNLIIYASNDGPHQVDLWAATRADNNSNVWSTTLITGDSEYEYNLQPAISDDGTKLLFAAGNSADVHGTEAILEVNVDGSGLQTLLTRASNAGAANATAYLEYPDYAPDGSIVFGSNWDNNDQIWRKPAGANPAAPVSAAINEFCPAVLPDGKIVTLWKDRLGNTNHVLEITLSYADGTKIGTLLPSVDAPLQSFGASA